MSELADAVPELLDAIAERTGMVVAALEQLDEDGLLAPSLLPGWSRLTITCHLRYGALAGHQLTRQALADRPAAFYPQGRERQRPATLEIRTRGDTKRRRRLARRGQSRPGSPVARPACGGVVHAGDRAG